MFIVSPISHFMRSILIVVGAVSICGATGCSKNDPRQNSNPHPQAITDQNQPAANPPPTARPPDASTGTDSTGRPGDASGGSTGQPSPAPSAEKK